MKTLFYLVLVFVSLMGKAQVPATARWQLAKQEGGIQVYTAPAGTSGRRYIKVTAELEGTLDHVKQLFEDITQQKDWVYATRRAYLLQKVSGNHLLYYNETALPWPVSNRDVAIRMQLTEDSLHHTLVISQEGITHAVPVTKGVVRVPHLVGNWQFRKEGEGRLLAVYYLDIDSGGSLPLWVVNLFIAKGPYQTFVNLQKKLRAYSSEAAESHASNTF